MFHRQKTEVLVAGAGPVGLFTALLLAEKGLRVEVIDEQWRSATRSYALALHPASLRLFNSLGFAKHLVEQGNSLDRVGLYDRKGKRAEIDYGKLAAEFPFVTVVPQQVLEEVLLEQLNRRGIKVRWNHRLAGLRQAEDGVSVTLERLAKESTGYSVARTEWVVDKTLEEKFAFVVGADGHRSRVRKSLSIGFEETAEAGVFAVFEFLTGVPSGDEMRIVLEPDRKSVLWPMSGGRFRWSFELADEKSLTDPRAKSRLFVQLRDEAFPHVTEEKLGQLIGDRAPWWEIEPTEVVWSAAIRFERRLANAFSQGRVALTGDSAHVALPIGIQSMNIGFLEAMALSSAIEKDLEEGTSGVHVAVYARQSRQNWFELLELTAHPPVSAKASDWVKQHVGQIPACIPASGDDLRNLLAQIL